MDEILGAGLYILGALMLAASAYFQRRGALAVRDMAKAQPKLLTELATYMQATPSGAPLDIERLDALERELKQLRRMHDDLDESTSRRFKRLQARNRRDEPDDDDEPDTAAPPPVPNRQLGFPWATPAAPTDAPASVPAGLPRLERIGR